MEIYRVSFIGHRNVDEFRDIENALDREIRKLLYQHEYLEFYVGRNGDFDIMVASAVKRAKKDCRDDNSSLILVLPYEVADMPYYEKFYDEIMIPCDITTHFKSAIGKRNEWLADNCDLMIAYVKRTEGGAYKCYHRAENRGVPILNLAE